MPSPEKQVAMEALCEEVTNAVQAYKNCLATIERIAIIEREKQPESKRETAEDVMSRLRDWIYGGMPERHFLNTWRSTADKALALIRAERERVERAIAVLLDAGDREDVRKAIDVLEGREP